ncbi:MAG: N-acetylmuramoyl-L-alanine amidase, partial [Bacteroidota bacterium]
HRRSNSPAEVMNEIIIYLLKVMAIHGVLYLFYRLFLRQSTKHSLNRGYLLSALVVAFVIPFIQLSLPEEKVILGDDTPIIHWLVEPSNALEEFELVPVQEDASFSWWSLIPLAFGIVTLILLTRSIVYLFILQKLKKHSEPIKKRWFTLFRTSQDRPFSFFRNVFMPRDLFGSDSFRQVLAHECVHVRQLHSVDRLLLDFVVSLFWFNPFIYLYRSALIEIHEYQADEAVVKRFKDPVGYQEILFSQLQSPQYSGLVSHFNVEMIKKRIVMMNKPKKRTGWVYVLTRPVTLMMVFAFSSKEAMQPLNDVGDELSGLIGPIDDIKEVAVNYFQQDYEPSILPFKETENVRFTSGFGMRMHPIEKVKKRHFGVDFACKMRTEIVSTADGTVLKVERNRKGYGNLLTIAHGDQFETKYAQLSEFKVKEGEKVKKGQVVALSGNSGMSTAPHLHYEVLKDGKRVNPKTYITNYKFALLKEIPSTPHSHAKDETLEELKRQELELAKELESVEKMKLEEAYAREADERRAMESQMMEEQARMKELELYELEKMKRMEERMMEEIKYVEQEEARRAFEEIKLQKEFLYILDGEEVDDIGASVNVEDIKSVEVIKHQRARDLYGKKGKNGVVVIKTKDKDKNKNKNKPKNKLKSKTKQKDKKKEQAFNVRTNVKAQATMISTRDQGKYRVIIDPGHGGKDHGATSPSGASEKEISLAIAKMVQDHFTEESKIKIVLTREEDDFLELKDRSKQAMGADLFISLHTDNYTGEGSFVVPVYNDMNEYSDRSKRFAKLLASEFESCGKEAKVGYSSGYAVLRDSKCPAVLLNVGWFSDPVEDEYLSSNSGQQEVATQISDAIRLAAL